MNDDRHFTSTSKFSLIIESTCLRFSGARLGIYGMNDELYEICVDKIVIGEFDGNTITIIERLGGRTTRKSILEVSETP